MGLLLVRHSDASQGGGPIDDAARWLTRSGRDKAFQVAEALKARGLSFTRFVTSPRVRAVQTAEIFAQVLGFRGAIESLPSLSYTAPAQQAARELAAFDGHIAAFGHMPTIAEIAQMLCTRPVTADGFAPSEAWWIEQGKRGWAIDPSTL